MNRFVRALSSTRSQKLLLNIYPPYLMTGIVVREISSDWRQVKVQMGLHWYNRNYFGTHFGGSLYAMTDPFYTLMLARNLGTGYIVWDRSAEIDFLRPGRDRVTAVFELTQAMIDTVVAATRKGEKHQAHWLVEIRDTEGEVVARVRKTL